MNAKELFLCIFISCDLFESMLAVITGLPFGVLHMLRKLKNAYCFT